MSPPAQRPITHHPIQTLSVCLISAETHTALSRHLGITKLFLPDYMTLFWCGCCSHLFSSTCAFIGLMFGTQQRTCMTGYWIRLACRHELSLNIHIYSHVCVTYFLCEGPPEAVRPIWCIVIQHSDHHAFLLHGKATVNQMICGSSNSFGEANLHILDKHLFIYKIII